MLMSENVNHQKIPRDAGRIDISIIVREAKKSSVFKVNYTALLSHIIAIFATIFAYFDLLFFFQATILTCV
jgi:hypothetical protein